MKLLKLIKELFTAPQTKNKTNSEHEDFMKLMQWGCYNDVRENFHK